MYNDKKIELPCRIKASLSWDEVAAHGGSAICARLVQALACVGVRLD